MAEAYCVGKVLEFLEELKTTEDPKSDSDRVRT